MTKTIKLEESTAKKLYKTASSELRTILEENFGKALFSEKITDRIKTWEDVCEELGIDDSVLPYKNPKGKQQISTNAFVKIQYISQVLNEGWEPNFKNTNEYKYYPWFEYRSFSPGGDFGFGYSFACSVRGFMGSGFYYKTKELSDYAGKQFLEIYQEYLP